MMDDLIVDRVDRAYGPFTFGGLAWVEVKDGALGPDARHVGEMRQGSAVLVRPMRDACSPS